VELDDTIPKAPNGSSLIYVELAMEAAESSEILAKMRYKRKLQDTPESHAIWNGSWELRTKAHRCVAIATKRGQLLFCFPSTTVLQQGGAA